ncbi:transglycosylase SLT domain-containing protein [Candidatus Poribacteria bacterium]|jgi:hypothetical protein|nr:transglycosylase SLT domain-containing protein [Candidatus Poribacteria bacterium]MBT5711717.1 transglycosylase SLT domain-containing protein [Candidatus Poribacteria bacterium]MBT7099999.1 transglycosylase SLT domain-containing protein [Candidatus Poribacteria bacterium]MBT7804063.1 transglycosylase SLT domain-containing protein [Candidatus Poribacteria bacterium]
MLVRLHATVWLAAGIYLLATGAQASDASDGFGVGARPAGMAGITSTVADRGSALFGNPALLPDVDDAGFLLDAGQGAVAASLPLGRVGAIAAGALDLDHDDRFLIDQPWNPVGTFRTGANRASVAYGVRPYARMSLGATLDGWRSAEGDWSPGNTIGVSLTPTGPFEMGGQAHFRRDAEWLWSVGAAWRPAAQFQLRAELMPEAYAFGVESEWRRLSVRAGLRSSTDALAPGSTGAYGVTLNVTQSSAVHYAYQFDTEHFSGGRHSLSFDVPRWAAAGATNVVRRARSTAARPAGPAPTEPRAQAASRPAVVIVPPGTTPQRVIKSAVDKTPDIPGNARRSLRRLIEHHSEKYGVETPLILAVMRAESGFDPAAISTSKAVGLFQLLPPAARDMGIDIPASAVLDRRRDGRFHPIRNADAGIRYMAHLLQRFDWNYVLAVSAYNAGPGNVNGSVPRMRETERHVGKVLNYYYGYRNDPAQLAAVWRQIEAIEIPN